MILPNRKRLGVIDITGQKFYKLTAIRFLHMTPDNRRSIWLFSCECGKEIIKKGTDVKSGNSKSCGCMKRGKAPDIENSAKSLLYSMYKHDAKTKKRTFSLTKEEFIKITGSNCDYCGIEPRQILKNRNINIYVYNGIDRVDNNLGYISSNVVPCCRSCNVAKAETSLEDFLQRVKRIYEHRIQS